MLQIYAYIKELKLPDVCQEYHFGRLYLNRKDLIMHCLLLDVFGLIAGETKPITGTIVEGIGNGMILFFIFLLVILVLFAAAQLLPKPISDKEKEKNREREEQKILGLIRCKEREISDCKSDISDCLGKGDDVAATFRRENVLPIRMKELESLYSQYQSLNEIDDSHKT